LLEREQATQSVAKNRPEKQGARVFRELFQKELASRKEQREAQEDLHAVWHLEPSPLPGLP